MILPPLTNLLIIDGGGGLIGGGGLELMIVCDTHWILDVTIVMDDTASREVYYARATGREAESSAVIIIIDHTSSLQVSSAKRS